ncbi:MAG: NnrS family protein [Chthoniobacterales bacterium]
MRTRSQSLQLLCAEPFRIFFPAGIFLGVAGVSLWIFYYAGLIDYPGTWHARLMIEGFMTSFVFGFLGTAGPRITSTRPFSPNESLTLLTALLLVAGLHFGGATALADLLFVLTLVLFLLTIGKRFVRREDSPPPNFALVALGLLNGLVGASLLAFSEKEAYSTQYHLGALLLEQGFILLPILGVAPFFIPRLLDLPREDDRHPLFSLIFAIAVGLIIDASFIAEANDYGAFAVWLRFAAIVIYLALRLPCRGRSFLANCLRLGILTIVIGVAIEGIWPLARVGALHIIFISGFSFIVLTVAIRVIFGHSGNAHLFQKRLPFFIISAVLISLAMISRYVADIAPAARNVHLVAAAVVWIAAALIWWAKVIPKVRIPDPED